ncbi:hypothetical protein CRENBAI_001096 [Crenichthys baileyi]|uniref:NADH dehydrogenase [ubiquinone] flavoprotein 3, mitochondrial n=1 Tax=Crenichthys baileyi TaxID=28760 RepID=A0AAV9SP55_9TELE
MAAWLLRSGRLGSLKFDSWGTLRHHPTVGFCIEAKEPAKAVKSTKGPEKTGEDERAALWVYKTAVAFPVKFSDPRILSPFLGVTEEPISFTATSDIAPASFTSATKFVEAESESVAIPASPDPYRHQEVVSHILADEALPVILLAGEASAEASGKGSVPGEETPAVTIDDVVKTAKVSSKLGDSGAEELSSSSSSDSDTDSECDPEDKKLEVETETRSCSSELQQPSHQEKGEIEELIVTGVTKGITSPETEAAQSIVVAFRDNSQDLGFKILTAPKAAGELTSSEFPTNAAATITDALYEALPLVVVQIEAHEKAWPNAPGNALDLLTEPTGLGDAGEEFWEKTAIGPVESETVSANVAADHPAEVGSSADAEKLVDSAQVLEEATGEKLHAETAAEQPEESAEAPPEPEEPFDNSTYKNYQHHSYTSYTFADLDVEMAKYRLPQPSSGKPSPRH